MATGYGAMEGEERGGNKKREMRVERTTAPNLAEEMLHCHFICQLEQRSRTLTDAVYTDKMSWHTQLQKICSTTVTLSDMYTYTFSLMSYTYSCTFYPWTVNELHSVCHATWGMRYVCIFDSQQSLPGYCGRLVGLVKMHVRKCRVTDVAFLLSHTNVVILPLPRFTDPTHTTPHTHSSFVGLVTTCAHSWHFGFSHRSSFLSRVGTDARPALTFLEPTVGIFQKSWLFVLLIPKKTSSGVEGCHLSDFHIKNCHFKCFQTDIAWDNKSLRPNHLQDNKSKSF